MNNNANEKEIYIGNLTSLMPSVVIPFEKIKISWFEIIKEIILFLLGISFLSFLFALSFTFFKMAFL